MDPLKVAAIFATGFMLSGCVGSWDGLSASSGRDIYTDPGYNGTLAYPAPGRYAQPSYAAPYAYQPGYPAPYVYEPGWGGGRDSWREREGREHREHRNEGREPGGQPHQDSGRQVPPTAMQPHSVAPPPPAARPQADQNQKLLDQLGFRPSR